LMRFSDKCSDYSGAMISAPHCAHFPSGRATNSRNNHGFRIKGNDGTKRLCPTKQNSWLTFLQIAHKTSVTDVVPELITSHKLLAAPVWRTGPLSFLDQRQTSSRVLCRTAGTMEKPLRFSPLYKDTSCSATSDRRNTKRTKSF